jgi:hypothetical protein
MKLSRNQYNILFLIVISFILFVLLFKWIDYLTSEKYIFDPRFDNVFETFTNGIIQEKLDGTTSHTVDLPLTTSYSCKNFCGPNSRCSITGQQCFTDIDCPGCQPYVPPLKKTSQSVPGDNDAGKLTIGVTPQYSSLTSGYGTHETIITSNMYSKPAEPNFGVDVWKKSFDEDNKLFDKRYRPSGLQFMSNYPKKYTLSGEFVEDGPYASNAYIEKN